MSSPPQPARKTIIDDLDLGVTGGQVRASKRQAANQRQQKAAEEAEAHERWRLAMVEENWGPQ
jgi:hypothetical protein